MTRRIRAPRRGDSVNIEGPAPAAVVARTASLPSSIAWPVPQDCPYSWNFPDNGWYARYPCAWNHVSRRCGSLSRPGRPEEQSSSARCATV